MKSNTNIDTWKILEQTHDGLFKAGSGGVATITAPADGRSEFVALENGNVLVTLPFSAVPVYYPLVQHPFKGPAKAVLMDLDGTSVKSEGFWIWIIEQTVCRLKGDPDFQLSEEDIPYVSGFSVSEHLKYCLEKYQLAASLETARKHYFDIVHYEMQEIMEGRGKEDAYAISDGLKEFLLQLKAHDIKIGLVTSGLYEKAIPEIISGFRQMNQEAPNLGAPLEFYDAVITAGTAFAKGQAGTPGELCSKPHPWLYRETCEVGLGIHEEDFAKVVVLEDSSAGVVAGRLAGFDVIGMKDGNIEAAGLSGLVCKMADSLEDALAYVLGEEEVF